MQESGHPRRNKAGLVRLVLAFSVVILHFILVLAASGIAGKVPLFLFFFASSVLLPGYLLTRLLVSNLPALVNCLYSLIAGVAIFFVVMLCASIYGPDVRLVGMLLPCVSIPLALALYLRSTRDGLSGKDKERVESWPGKWRSAAFIGLCALAAILILSVGDPFLYSGDSQDHVAYIRTISRTGEIFPDNFLYPDGGLLTKDIRKGLLHTMWGTLIRLTGDHAAHEFWPWISTIGSLSMILALFSAGLMLFRSWTIGLIAAGLFVFCYHGGLSSRQLITIAYPFPFVKIFYLGLICTFPLTKNPGAGRTVILTVACSIAAVGGHVGYAVLIAAGTIVYIAVTSLGSEPGKRTTTFRRLLLALALPIVFSNMPYGLFRYIEHFRPNNVIHTHTQGVLYLTDSLYIANPIVLLEIGGTLLLLATISVFLLWKMSRREENLRFLLAGTAMFILIVLNPLLFPPLTKRMSYLVFRMEFVAPSMLICSYLVRELLPFQRGNPIRLSTRKIIIGWISCIILIGHPLLKTFGEFAYAGRGLESAMRYSCLGLKPLFEELGKLPAGSVIASDPITSYSIPAFTDQYVVCTYDQHSIPNDSTAIKRILDCRNLFLPSNSIQGITEVLERYEADHIVLNGRIPTDIISMYWKPDASTVRDLVEKLRAANTYFHPIAFWTDLALFRLAHHQIQDSMLSAIPSRTGSERQPVGDIERLPRICECGLYMARSAVSRNRVARGDTMTVVIGMTGNGTCEPGSYIAYLRFDNEFERGPLYHDWYGKIYRKILERRKGLRYRFRQDRNPFNGLFPPDMWPPGEIVRDRIVVRIPMDISPGSYDISLRIEKQTQYPNYSMRDLFMNEDMFEGPVICHVTIY